MNAERDPSAIYRRAGELFDELVELEPAQRTAALEAAQAEDPEVATLVSGMLARDATSGALGQLDVATDEQDPAGVIGTRVGPYLIESLIGRGGMGAVYLGRRRDPDQRVAIKFVTLSAAPAAALARFQSEVRLLARIEHPGIVRYRDSGVDDHGRPYLAMDLVDGEPLTHELPEIAGDVGRAVAIVAAVAEAVHHLHQRRVLHRDLKPSNVLVKRDGEALVPIVIDLGIARALSDEGLEGDGVAATGSLGLGPVGTPSFMSPEQAQAGTTVDVRADVHALGALLHSLLTGHPPRGLDQPAASDPLEFQRRLRETEARAPSLGVDAELFGAEGARRRARGIDRDLDAVVLKALALRPDDRYGSCEALAADLLRWLGGLPVNARLVGPLGRLRRLVRRRPLASLVTVGTAALLAAALFTTLQSRADEALAQGRYKQQLAVSRQINRFFTESVLSRASIDVDGPDVPAIDLLRAAAVTLETSEGLHPSMVVATRGTLMQVFQRMGATEDAELQLKRAAPVAAKLPPHDPVRLQFDAYHGIVLLLRGEWERAEEMLLYVHATASEVPDAPMDILLTAAQGLGYVSISKGALDQAQTWLQLALDTYRGLDPSDLVYGEQYYLELRGNLALLLAMRGDAQAAAEALRSLIEEVDDGSHRKRPALVTLLASLASLETDLGQPTAALEHVTRAAEIAEQTLPFEHPTRLSAMNNLASVHANMGQVTRAIEIQRSVHTTRMQEFGPTSELTALAAHNLASFLDRAGQYEEARALAEGALDTFLEVVGEAHVHTASAFRTLGNIERGAGNTELAVELFDEALRIFADLEGDHEQELTRLRAIRDELAAQL